MLLAGMSSSETQRQEVVQIERCFSRIRERSYFFTLAAGLLEKELVCVMQAQLHLLPCSW